MAKAARHRRSTPCEPYRQAAARIVRVRADELFAHADGVLDTRRHRARARHARRLAAAARGARDLRAVLPADASSRRVLRDVKQLADALGERRDPDVHIDALRGFAEARAGAAAPGVARMVEASASARRAGNEVLAAELERARERGLHGRLLALADARAPDGGPRREGAHGQGPRPRRPLADNAERIVARAARRAVRVHAARGRPERGRRAARHAHRRQAPALHPRGHRRRASARTRRRRRSMPRTCRTCSARSTTATSRSPRCGRSPSGCVAEDAAALRAAAGEAPDLDPALLAQAPHARDHAGPGGAAQSHLRARRRLLFDRFLELWARARAQGLPRAARVRGRRARRRSTTRSALASRAP